MLEHEWDRRSVDFPLKAGAVVLDIGGYKGRWSKEMATRYPDAWIYTFEPQGWAFAIASTDLAEFKNIGVYNYGLGVESGKFEMEEFETDGASFVLGFSKRQQAGEGSLVEMKTWLDVNKIDHIDLIMMNIEAYEFKLIPYMIEKGIMQRVGYFMCQFHPRNYEQQDEFEAIKKQMAEFMDVHFDYGIMLMCWKVKEVVSDQPLAVSQMDIKPSSVAFETGQNVAKGITAGLEEKPKRRTSTAKKKTE